LAKSVVEERIRRRIAVGKMKRLLIIGLIAVLVVSPLVVNLASEYLGLNGSILKIDSASFYPVIGPTGNFVINWHMISGAGRGEILNPTGLAYRITIDNSQQLTAACPPAQYGYWYDCVMIPGVTGSELNGSIVGFSVTGVVSQVVWRQEITRSASFACNIPRISLDGSFCF
jgi:hypothetical protein